jgi:hypothetical protein
MTNILRALIDSGVISPAQAKTIGDFESSRTFSVHGELRTILYLGTLLFSAGIGVLIYENIDTIGHQAIIAALALLTAGAFVYTFKHSPPFSRGADREPHKTASYMLLLGCTTFLILEGYAQHEYQIFGERYGLATLIPTILFFCSAYRFDHAGVLSLAITGLASWLGLTIAPLSVLTKNDFTDPALLWSAMVLGVALIAIARISVKYSFKAHFAFTYLLLGGNLALAASLAGLINEAFKLPFFLVGAALSCFYVYSARQVQSKLFLVIGVIYGYIILTYSLFHVLGEVAAATLGIFYFTFSSAGVVYFLLNFKKMLGVRK